MQPPSCLPDGPLRRGHTERLHHAARDLKNAQVAAVRTATQARADGLTGDDVRMVYADAGVEFPDLLAVMESVGHA